LTAEQSIFAQSVRGFAEKHLAKDALKRAHDPKFRRRRQADGEERPAGNHAAGAGWRPGGAVFDAIVAIVQVAQVCPRRADVVQAGIFGPDPNLRRIRDPRTEGPVSADLLPATR